MNSKCMLQWAGWLAGFLIASSVHAQKVELVAGGGKGGEGSKAADAAIKTPFGYVRDKEGSAYLVEFANRVLKIDKNGVLTAVAGSGEKGPGGDGGPALKAQFESPHALAIGPDGAVYIADTWNWRVRRADLAAGTITTFAGTGKKGYSGDGGPATKADFSGIYCIAFDPSGKRLLITDLENRRIRAVDMATGVVTTVAGNGSKGVPKDGDEAAKSPLVDPRAAIADEAGNVYVLERGGHALRLVDPAGKVRTVAGTGKAGATGDGGPALEATMNGPKHLCLDADGTVLIADTENHLIRRYDPKDGTMRRVAGTGKKGKGGVGESPDKLELFQPHGVYVAGDGTLYISDSKNDRVLKLSR